MKRKKKPQSGTAVVFLNTDMEQAKPLSPDEMTDLQRQAFAIMAKEQQQQILSGCGAYVMDLESGNLVCKFNMENYRPPKWAIDSLARSLVPIMKRELAREKEKAADKEHDPSQQTEPDPVG